MREGSDALRELAGMIPSEPDHVPYRAHLTLARVSRVRDSRGGDARARDVRELVTALDALAPSPTWTVDDLVLFESTTHADGAVHTERARFKLAGEAHAPP